jgi:hypothetical protein
MRLFLMKDLKAAALEKARLLPAPKKYLWIAVWWHLHAREDKAPEGCLIQAKWQLRLAKDMCARPDHFRAKPADVTDWQWSGLSSLISR